MSTIDREALRDVQPHCMDCGLPYAAAAFQDLVLPDWAWRRINPAGDGLLCPNCIVARCVTAGLANVPAYWASGPLVGVTDVRALAAASGAEPQRIDLQKLLREYLEREAAAPAAEPQQEAEDGAVRRYVFTCENCGKEIRDDEPFDRWADGVLTHQECAPPDAADEWAATIEQVAQEEMAAWKAARFEHAYEYARRIAQRVVAAMTTAAPHGREEAE